jgi:outer membrane protein assembly factor BamB
MKLLISAILILYLGCSINAALLPDKYWPAWRGADNSGSTVKGSYPAKFSNTENVLWKAELPGKGCSTPIVWGERIVLTCSAQGSDAILAYDWSGGKLWQTKVGMERKGKHRNGSGSNPSVVTDGKNKNSWLIAFDKETGKVDWQVERNYDTPTEGDHSYATPIVRMENGRETILIWGAERLTSHSAVDGSILWSCAGFNSKAKKNWVVVGSHIVSGEMVVVPYGRGSHLAGIRLGGRGDVTATHRTWTRTDSGSFVPTPALADGKVYILRDRGEVHCVNPENGKSHWEDKFPRGSSSYYSSPVVAGNHLYATREDGKILTAKIEGGFQFLHENDMGERLIASPVPVAGKLLIRGEKHLFCIGQ